MSNLEIDGNCWNFQRWILKVEFSITKEESDTDQLHFTSLSFFFSSLHKFDETFDKLDRYYIFQRDKNYKLKRK